ncbi:MAG: hypothetical protein HOO91_21255 [Bacteroidales bacterium]|nr:hypothetical protein [Bacteroidales bacterium]
MKKNTILFVLFISTLQLFAQKNNTVTLSVFAETENQWTGIAISKTDRFFVNFPRWSAETPVSVAEIVNGKLIPFPNATWNNWDPKTIYKNKFICVQSIYIDDLNTLWVLDTGYELATDSTKEAHLYGFNLTDNSLQNEYVFPNEIITGKAYLNDFRIDNKRKVAYFSDSNVGGIVILNLKTKEIRRVLSQHPSTLSEVEKIVIEGYERNHPVQSDGIELDEKKQYLYYCALMGKNVYRIPTKALLNKKNTDSILGERVEKFAQTGANDGIIFDKQGNLYLSSLEKNAIGKIDKKGTYEVVIRDSGIKWPDSFAFDSKGNLYFTISQIHLPKEKRGAYKIYKMTYLN